MVAADDFLEILEVRLTVANEVARDDHEIRRFVVGELYRRELGLDGSDSTHVQIRDVGDAQVIEPLGVIEGAGKATDGEVVAMVLSPAARAWRGAGALICGRLETQRVTLAVSRPVPEARLRDSVARGCADSVKGPSGGAITAEEVPQSCPSLLTN